MKQTRARSHFYPLPSGEGRRRVPGYRRPQEAHFYPLPSGEGRRKKQWFGGWIPDFYPLPSGEGRPSFARYCRPISNFYPLPSGEGRPVSGTPWPPMPSISIHSPRVRGDYQPARAVIVILGISIHSPRVRGDAKMGVRVATQIYFYPLPSGEGRRTQPIKGKIMAPFLSTPLG